MMRLPNRPPDQSNGPQKAGGRAVMRGPSAAQEIRILRRRGRGIAMSAFKLGLQSSCGWRPSALERHPPTETVFVAGSTPSRLAGVENSVAAVDDRPPVIVQSVDKPMGVWIASDSGMHWVPNHRHFLLEVDELQLIRAECPSPVRESQWADIAVAGMIRWFLHC